ncbi:hypothetical protein L0U85_08055 [Glycomyces sp. L485]|uniref:hypothetical protein n=1 Tax=Glycomyces sp. L485 TaxID=2909235 RepID=UPI001F4A5139|nr:hypothetical protein [Glycomyces sp. L485]MCH7230801.1 hypothetical protein [Glycomyces sp. L485]
MINSTLASTAFNTTGLEALGHASAQLSANWADTRPSLDEASMSLDSGAPWRAPIDGYLVWSRLGAPELTDHTGASLDGTVAVLRFHPQGALRLKGLAADRFDGGEHRRPTPFYAALRGGTPPSGLPGDKPMRPDTALAGEDIGQGRLTFHDERGLIIDPVAVACMMRDLLRAIPALHRREAGTADDVTDSARAGSVAQIAGLGTAAAVRLHLVDLFGKLWNDEPAREGVRIGSGARLGAGPHEWSGALTVTDDSGAVRIGSLPDGELGTAAISAPALPTTGVPAESPAPELERQFFRVAVADLGLHLAGNRGTGAIGGVDGADEATANEPAPDLGTGDLEVLSNGQSFLGAAGEIAGLSGTRLAVSPTIADDFPLPGSRTERWPEVPAPAGTAEDLTAEHSAAARADATAAYIGTTPDVVVTWPAGALPAEAFVRAFPRVDPGRATGPLERLRFSKRGDGGGAIVPAGSECRIRVRDPFGIGADPRPSSPKLVFDLLVVTRGPSGGAERLFGSVEIDEVGDGGTAPPDGTTPNAFDDIADDHRGIGPTPVLGLEQTVTHTGTDIVLDALGAAAPRESPRFATMARTETTVCGHDGAGPGSWTSVTGPGFLTADSLGGDARRGSPGLPAGPEEHAPGVRVTGPLAQHLARAALRRTHHIVTRLVELDDAKWNPVSSPSGNATGTVLQSVAHTVESPELRAALELVDVEALPDTWAGLISAIGSLLTGSLAPLDSLPTPTAGDRWVAEFKREARASHQGRRDAQWAWRWALSQARELVYIETALLSHTSDTTEDHKVDLVDLLLNRMSAEPNLKVVLVTPRRIPFGPGYEPFAHRMYLERNRAVKTLTDAFPKRVAAYHPVGFPGRPENLRGTFAVVDDVWALVGGSTFSRRGLTFDGSTDLAFVGHDLKDGVSATVRDARRSAMARVLGVGPREAGSTATPDPRWTQLAGRCSAFRLMYRTVANGGEGEVQPSWPGLPESDILAPSKDIVDPEGREFSSLLDGLAAALAGLGSDRL